MITKRLFYEMPFKNIADWTSELISNLYIHNKTTFSSALNKICAYQMSQKDPV